MCHEENANAALACLKPSRFTENHRASTHLRLKPRGVLLGLRLRSIRIGLASPQLVLRVCQLLI